MTKTTAANAPLGPSPVILLGAGASFEAGIPTARPMVDGLLERVRSRPDHELPIASIVEFVWRQLEVRHGSLVSETETRNSRSAWRRLVAPEQPDVESLVRALDRLAGRRWDELGGFVAAWLPELLELAPTSDVLVACRRALERALVDTVWRDDGDVSYLHPLVANASVDSPVTIATLNYDNTIERAAGARRKTFHYGFERQAADQPESFAASFEATKPEVRLLKLHGSANWSMREVSTSKHSDGPGLFSVRVVPDDDVRSESRRQSALIFGPAQKLVADFPFFDAFLAFRDALATATGVLIIGYSFRDAHINALLRAWFGTARTGQLTIVDPGEAGTESRVSVARYAWRQTTQRRSACA